MKWPFAAALVLAGTAGSAAMAESFANKLIAQLPNGITLDPKLVTTFDWMDAQGWMQTYDTGDGLFHYMPIYPPDQYQQRNTSEVSFGTSGLPFTGHWSAPDPKVDHRVAEIGFTSGDGGRVAIWLDDAGKQWFVHLGHDSVGVISDDPVVMLQFLAMGYLEPGALDHTDVTPLQSLLDYYGYQSTAEFADDEAETLIPSDFQTYLTEQFGTTAPATARDLGIADFVYYNDEASTDPFVQWLIKVTPPPTAEELAYIEELIRMAEDMNLDDLDLEEEPKPQGIIGKLKGLFGSNK